MDLKEYLKAWIKLSKKAGHTQIGNYYCFEEFVYRNGQLFKTVIYPKHLKRGQMKQCYKNAFMLMLENPTYHYTEGFARGPIPVMHAWCIDKNNNVIDPTWPNGKEYFGIIFKNSYVQKQVIENNGKLGLIDNWQQGWPLLKLNPKIWRAL